MAMDAYGTVKIVHMSCAAVSYILFLLRGLWRFTGSPMSGRVWVRTMPHAVDTVLLLSALYLASHWLPIPSMHGFLLTKVTLLLFYIALGMTAFRWGRTAGIRVAAWVGAQAVFLYLVGVALTKSAVLAPLWRS